MLPYAILHMLHCRCRWLRWPVKHASCRRSGELSDIYDGEHWHSSADTDKNISPDGSFTGKHLMFNLSGDGVAPFTHSDHSMWPLALSCLNLPPWLRMTAPTMWLVCIAPGPGEPKDFQPILDIVADELNFLYHHGVNVRDSSDSSSSAFTCKARLFQVIADYRGMAPLLWYSASPAHEGACYECHQGGFSHSRGKTIYPGEHAECKPIFLLDSLPVHLHVECIHNLSMHHVCVVMPPTCKQRALHAGPASGRLP